MVRAQKLLVQEASILWERLLAGGVSGYGELVLDWKCSRAPFGPLQTL